jgi:hypothetical protein
MIPVLIDFEMAPTLQARTSVIKALASLLLLLAPQLLFASDYTERRANAVQTCEKIDAHESQTGLVMNPDGYRSYYVRSQCLQKVAVDSRDPSLCSQVRRRWSLFSSWGISSSNCRKLVTAKIASDRISLEELKRAYAAGAIHLDALRIERNGNGRDFDLLPTFSGSYAHGYVLTFEILPPNHPPVVIHSNGYYVDRPSDLRIYVRQSDIRALFPEFELSHRYQVRATTTLSVPLGDMDGPWPDSFTESVFPARERSQSLIIEAEF